MKITVESGGGRLDVFLSEKLGLTRSKIKNMIDEGLVFLNGKHEKSGAVLKSDDVIEYSLPKARPVNAAPENLPIDILYEDNDIIVVNKQAGLTVHPGGGAYSGTLVNALLYHADALSGSGGGERPGIVHRLDKDTSGVMVVAKNDAAHLSLQKQISEKTAKRTYIALTEGVIKDNAGVIDKNIIRCAVKRKAFTTCEGDKGRTALTNFKVIKRFKSNTLVEFVLSTGRTHQIRVHAKFIGHPLVCDAVYGYKNQRFSHKGQLLHSNALELTHPVTGERMTFSAPLPEHFMKILKIVEASHA